MPPDTGSQSTNGLAADPEVPSVPAHIDQTQRRQRAVSVHDRPQNPVLHDDRAIIL